MTDEPPRRASACADSPGGGQYQFDQFARTAGAAAELRRVGTGVASGTWLGYQLRPLLAPLTLRAEPLALAAKVGLACGAAALVIGGAWALRREPKRPGWRPLRRH
jgi:hypothetical protein